MDIVEFFNARKRSLGQGNMFTVVCLSTGWVPGPGGAWSRGVPGPWGGGPGSGSRGVGGAWWRPPPVKQLLLWVVRILLECILVSLLDLSMNSLNTLIYHTGDILCNFNLVEFSEWRDPKCAVWCVGFMR